MLYEVITTYKYTIGKFYSYDDAKKMQDSIQADFPGAFIVAFKGNTKISIADALNVITSYSIHYTKLYEERMNLKCIRKHTLPI